MLFLCRRILSVGFVVDDDRIRRALGILGDLPPAQHLFLKVGKAAAAFIRESSWAERAEFSECSLGEKGRRITA
jgi:hypothetical protein